MNKDTMAILEKLNEWTGGKIELDPVKRAEILERENSNPEILAHKEKLIQELLRKWRQWGILQ